MVINSSTVTDESTKLRRERLREVSKERSQKWPNTLEAMRKSKENHRLVREQEEERGRVEIDKMEEQRRKKDRDAILKRSAQQRVMENDRMKKIRSEQTLSTTLQIRNLQVKEKQQRKMMEKEQDKMYHQEIMKRIREDEEREKRENDLRIQKAALNAKEQQEQLKLYTEKYLQRVEENRLDGIRMRGETMRMEIEEKKKNEEMTHKLKQTNDEMIRANEELKKLRIQQKEQDKKDFEKMEEFAKKSFESQERIKGHIQKKKLEKEELNHKIGQAVARDFQKRKSNESQRVERQVKERQDAEDKAAADKEERRKQEWLSIQKSRSEQLARRQAQKKLEKDEQMNMVSEWNKKIKEDEDAEKKKVDAHKTRMLEYRDFLHSQANEKKQKKQSEIRNGKDMDKQIQNQLDQEDAEFNNTVGQFLEGERKKGRNVVGVKRSLHNVQQEQLQSAFF
eukprot:TRINITY_DN3224_c0_g1_i1.p1 TRINITY_DN3224_c0_g1~~TRINITY_DN3224_c0_g1_i1.p1  ORF type:complete len:495 (-),score=184.86 TRINITY_DN3224_c0_g1_i1:223-1578(-)